MSWTVNSISLKMSSNSRSRSSAKEKQKGEKFERAWDDRPYVLIYFCETYFAIFQSIYINRVILVVSRSSLVNLINDLLSHHVNRLFACDDDVDIYEKWLDDRNMESNVF